MLALRPLWTLRDRYDHCLKLWSQDTQTKPLVVTAVGAGAAGVESMLCILHRLRQIRPDRAVHGHLVSRSRDILPGFSACARRLAHKALKNAQVTIQLDCDWSDTIAVKSDVLIWATGAQAHSWQLDPACRASLQVSAEGFIQVDQSLRSVSHPNIFATGDCADLPHSLPKAGVYAVRMAATLAANIRRAVAGQTLLPFETKPYALSLLNDGAGRAIASWRHIGFSGKWVWMLKDDIDRRFINRFRLNSSAKVKK